MSAPFHNEFENANIELERAREVLVRMREQLAAGTHEVSAKNRSLSVVVSSGGELQQVKFLDSSWRTMAPAELGALIVDTVRSAQSKARDCLADAMTGILPFDLPLDQMRAGVFDFNGILDDTLDSYRDVFRSDPTKDQRP